MRHNKDIIVLASTYPRWKRDSVPTFVEDFVLRISLGFKKTTVIVPHYKGSKRKESPRETVVVKRFRYFLPYSQESIAYGEFGRKKDVLYPVKAVLYMLSEFWVTLWTISQLKRRTNI